MTYKRLSALVDKIGIFLEADRSEWGKEDGVWFVEFKRGDQVTYQDFPRLYQLKRYVRQLNRKLEEGGLYDSAD